MSIITTIRKNSWIIIVMVGLGMFGFLLMDALNSKTGWGGQPSLGKVDGTTIEYKEFSAKEAEIFKGRQSGDAFGNRKSLWDYMVQGILVDNLANKMGLGIGKTELEDLMTGQNLSSAVQRRFADPQTGQLSQEFGQYVEMYKKNKAQLNHEFVASLEKEVITTAITQKLGAMVQKSIYTPKWMAEAEQVRTQPIDFKFVPVPYTAVKDTEVKVSDAELKDYISRHAKLFTNEEESRNIAYAAFNVTPTAADSAGIFKTIDELAAGLRKSVGEDKDSTYCANNDGVFNGLFFKKSDIPGSLGDTAFKFPVATVVGPYPDGGFYRVAKIVARQTVSDSVRVRDIVVQVRQGESDVNAKTRVDSFLKAAQAGAPFDSLAAKMQGFNKTFKMVGYAALPKAMNDLVFFKATPMQFYTVKSQYGWHLVQIAEKKGATEMVKLAFLSAAIVPSKETEDLMYRKAQEFAQKSRTLADIEKMAKTTPGFQFKTAQALKENDFGSMQGDMAVGETSRNIVKWAYTAKVGDVSPEVFAYNDAVNQYPNKYMIVGLKSVTAKGLASVEDVREQVTFRVRNEKKAEIIKQKIGATTDMDAIAKMFASEVKEAGKVTMNSPFVPGLGSEPKAIAAALATDVNKTSKPVVGENGVFVVMPVNKPALEPITDLNALKRQLDMPMLQAAGNGFFDALRKNAKITDNRSTFF